LTSKIILAELLRNKEYVKKVISHLKGEYFETLEEKELFLEIKKFIIKYKSLPSVNALKVELSANDNYSSELFENIINLLDQVVELQDKYDLQWLIDSTENWCKERALYNAILSSVQIIEEKKNVGNIPEIVRKALQVQFDKSVGIDFLHEKGINERWELYQKRVEKYSTGIFPLDAVMAGGIESKSLSILMGGTHSGKTSSLIALGSNFLRNGYNVCYITLEMAEEKIAQRFDANFLDININDVPGLKEFEFKKRINKIKEKSVGRLIIKEYAPASVGTVVIRGLLEELKLKREFQPQLLIVDYLNLLRSDRVKNDSMYLYVKSIAEELRGLAVEEDIAVVTATQGNRAMNAEDCSDVDITAISESKGTADTADFCAAIISPLQLRENNQQIWKILKNRFGGIVNHKIPLKTDFAKCKLFEMQDREITISDNNKINELKVKTEENRLQRKNMINTDIDNDFDPGEDIWETLGVQPE
jgi:replicative DNA helicase